jgi:RimJ/RimL family protein N-acetyltransferase
MPMLLLTPSQAASLRAWFLPERPGPLVAPHVLETGHGVCLADDWPDPRAVFFQTGDNYVLAGEPSALSPQDLRERVDGFVDCPARFDPLLLEAFPSMVLWKRVVLELDGEPPAFRLQTPATLTPLGPECVPDIEALDADLTWIHNTWGSAAGMAASGRAWGAFVDGRLASVACSFFVGQSYEDIGIVTEPEYRGRSLAAACAAALCRDIQSRGKTPSWTTSPENQASRRVAEKLGFNFQRDDRLLITSTELP